MVRLAFRGLAFAVVEEELIPVADHLAAIAVALLAVPNGKRYRNRFAGNEFHIVRVLGFQVANENDIPKAVVPDAFARDVLLRDGL